MTCCPMRDYPQMRWFKDNNGHDTVSCFSGSGHSEMPCPCSVTAGAGVGRRLFHSHQSADAGVSWGPGGWTTHPHVASSGGLGSLTTWQLGSQGGVQQRDTAGQKLAAFDDLASKSHSLTSTKITGWDTDQIPQGLRGRKHWPSPPQEGRSIPWQVSGRVCGVS